MDTCVIFCAGEFDRLAQPLAAGDAVLAADGGLVHTQALGITPRWILGDFDSLGYVPAGAQVFPVEKDDTDSMLAARRGLAEGFRRFVFYGALDGPRLDHTLANLQTLGFLARAGAEGYLVGSRYLVTALRGGTLEFSPEARGVVSLFCLGEPARVTLEGLQYPLDRGELTAFHPLGVSNHFLGRRARITVHGGCLLVLWDRENGFPARKEGGL